MNRKVALVALAAAIASALLLSDVRIRDGPTATPEPLASPPAATATQVPRPTPSPMRPPEPPPTATPTEPYAYTEAEDVTARAIVRRCTYYLRLVDRWNPDFHLDPVLVLSIMAQESHCLTTATDPFSESLGLMQVNPANGLASAESLSSPALNVYWGMRVFWLVLNDEERNPQHDLTIALQAYNCGWRDKCGVGKDLCAQKGQTCGSDYADRILRFWYPRVWDVMLERGLLPDDLQTPVP